MVCAAAAAAHYRGVVWADPWQPIGWLLSMFFLLLAFSPNPRELPTRLQALIQPKTAFFFFWILLFVVSHLWNFRTAPWNGNALFDESGWDLWFLKSYVMGHPYQPAWFHFPISRETLFHYYVWGFLKLFGFNILSYQAALFCVWLTTFVFTLLLVHLFFESYIVTSVAALILNFLPFAFIYTFAGYRYPMAVAVAVVSLYFLHLGFRSRLVNGRDGSPIRPQSASLDQGGPRQGEQAVVTPYYSPVCINETGSKNNSAFALALGGIAAGLCLASSISGKQYLLALVSAAPLYALFYWRTLKRAATWTSLALVAYGFVAAATPILLYIAFNRNDYTLYENSFFQDFWHAMQSAPFPTGIKPFTKQLWDCFFAVPGPRFFIPDALPIPLPYYFFLLPGFLLALWYKRFEIVLLAAIPVLGSFIAKAIENRLLLGIPFWVVLMSFTFAGLLRLRRWPGVQIVLSMVAALILLYGLGPSVRYIYAKTQNPFSIHHYAQEEVAVSRFLRHLVAGEAHPGSPRLERDEFNRLRGVSDPQYETLICPKEAYSIAHLFLHDYDDSKVLSFCGGSAMYVMNLPDIWKDNKTAILNYVPSNKSLKLIWEQDPSANRIIAMLRPLHDLGTEETLSFTFGGKVRMFHVFNIPNKDIRSFQDRVRTLPAAPGAAPHQFNSQLGNAGSMFEGGKGAGSAQFDAPTAIAVDGNGNFLVADTGNGRIEKFLPTGTFATSIGDFEAPSGVAVDHRGNIYVAEIGSRHRVQKLAPDGKFIAEWKGPEPGFYGPRRITVGLDDSIYVIDSGRNRIVKFNPDGQVLASWGSEGSGDGQFKGVSSVAVDAMSKKLYVADPLNRRIQVFDTNGKFLTKWSVPEWGQTRGYEDLAVDPRTGRLYASSAYMNSVLIFDLNGTRIGSLTQKPPDRLQEPSALVLANHKLYVLNMAGNRVSPINLNQ